MSVIVTGIGYYDVSADPSSIIRTIGLGSCVAVVIHDPIRRVAGLAHVVLPESAAHDTERNPPAYFADLGVPRLLKGLARHGTGPRMGPLQVWIVGGGNPTKRSEMFSIGDRNVTAVRKLLKERGLPQFKECVGGTEARTVEIHVGSGELSIRSPSGIQTAA